ncbi:MAG TPA: hypothetical protein ENI68_04435 [Gammaproteobacteria bacterium]|nr:hypothetical protein [Gammaproteobacteria bacterium]
MNTEQKLLPALLTCFVCACLFCTPVWAGDNAEFFLLFNIDGLHYTNESNNLNLDENDLDAGVDLFYVYHQKNNRLLVEYFAGTEESELERLQYDYQLNDYATIKIGRMYTPLGYWSTRFHHGIYFQTSASRPQIVKNEDAGGILPIHITGVTLAGSTNSRSNGWQYNLMLGIAPNLSVNGSGNIELSPFDLLNPHKGAQNNPAAVFKLHYITNDKLQTDSGISIQVQKTDAHEIGLFYIKQNIINFYSHLDFIGKRIIASGFYVKSRLSNPSGDEIRGNFVNAYLQYEQDIFTHWTAYGRVENAWRENNDPYLALFPGFINRQVVTGLRYDFTKSQAVNLEYSDARKVSNKFSSLTLQWSAIFP